MEPQHHMGQETSAIDVKDLLAAMPVKTPTLDERTRDLSSSSIVSVSSPTNARKYEYYRRDDSFGQLDVATPFP